MLRWPRKQRTGGRAASSKGWEEGAELPGHLTPEGTSHWRLDGGSQELLYPSHYKWLLEGVTWGLHRTNSSLWEIMGRWCHFFDGTGYLGLHVH